MLRKLHSTVMEKFCTVYHGMHKEILAFFHVAYLIPSENLVCRKTVSVLHDLFAGSSLLLINEITDEKIHGLSPTCQFIKCFQDLIVGVLIYPVITVHNLEIKSCCVFDSCVDCLSMASIFLMYGFYDSWIFLGIIICDLGSTVTGAIIYNDNLHFLSSDQQGIDAF